MGKSATYHEKMEKLGLKKLGIFVPEEDVDEVKDFVRVKREAHFERIGYTPYSEVPSGASA